MAKRNASAHSVGTANRVPSRPVAPVGALATAFAFSGSAYVQWVRKVMIVLRSCRAPAPSPFAPMIAQAPAFVAIMACVSVCRVSPASTACVLILAHWIAPVGDSAGPASAAGLELVRALVVCVQLVGAALHVPSSATAAPPASSALPRCVAPLIARGMEYA